MDKSKKRAVVSLGSSKIRDSSTEENAGDLKKPKKEKTDKVQKGKNFRCVIQTDYPKQMEVFNWLVNCLQYTCVWILHDKDVFTADDMGENGIHTRKNGDGTESQFSPGDLKPSHYHMYIETGVSLSERAMEKRFADVLDMQLVADPMYDLLYFTHETFSGRGKYIYPRSDIQGDISTYEKRVRELKRCSSSAVVLRIREAFDMFDGNKRQAVSYLCSVNDDDAVSSILAHSNFYDKFL